MNTFKYRLRALFPNVTVEQLAFSDRSMRGEMKAPIIRGVSYTSRATLERFVDRNEEDAPFSAAHNQAPDAFKFGAYLNNFIAMPRERAVELSVPFSRHG